MSNKPCAQCEEHAKLHSGNWLGIGPANDPCPQCEAHARMHSSEGCGGLLMVLAALAAVAALVACTPGPGPAGRVVDKDRDWQPTTKTFRYELTVRTKGGDEVEFRVTDSDYDNCYRGSAYPTCTSR